MRTRTYGVVTASALLLMAGSAFAQVPQRTRGMIVSVNGNDMVMNTVMGHMTAHLGDDTHVAGVHKASLDDIKSNSFIGTAAVPASNGKLRALEVTIFPDSMRGTGEGSYPWDLGKSGSMTNGAVSSMTNGTVAPAMPASSMTNGTVGAMSDSHGRMIEVTYKGGKQMVALPNNIPVVMIDPGDKAMLKAGAKVVVFGPVSGKTVDAQRIIVGEDGIKPPM